MDQRESIPAVYAILEEEEAVATILRDAGRWMTGGGVFLSLLTIWIAVEADGYASLTALCGGIVGLVAALTKPGRPLRGVTYQGNYPKQLLPLEQRIQEVILRRRKRWLMVVVSMPSLGMLTALSFVADSVHPPPGSDGWLAGVPMMGLGFAGVSGIAWGVQCVQVHRAFRQEATLHTTER